MHGCDPDMLTWTQMQAALDEAQHAAAMARDELAAYAAKNAAPIAERDRLRRALQRLLNAYPRLSSDHSTTEQQRALRVAICALEETSQ